MAVKNIHTKLIQHVFQFFNSRIDIYNIKKMNLITASIFWKLNQISKLDEINLSKIFQNNYLKKKNNSLFTGVV